MALDKDPVNFNPDPIFLVEHHHPDQLLDGGDLQPRRLHRGESCGSEPSSRKVRVRIRPSGKNKKGIKNLR